MTIVVTSLGTGNTYGSGNPTVTGVTANKGDWLIVTVATDVASSYVSCSGHGVLEKVLSVANAGNSIVEIWAGKLHADILSQTITAVIGDTSAITAYKATNLGNATSAFSSVPGDGASFINLYAGAQIRVGNGGWFAASQITGATFSLKSSGSPTGTAYCRVYRTSDNKLLHTFGSIDVSTLTTSPTDYTFNDSSYTPPGNTHTIICMEYSGGGASNYIQIERDSGISSAISPVVQYNYLSSWTLSDTAAVDMALTGTPELDAADDKSATSTGSSGSPSSGATATLSQAAELAIGAIGMEHKLTESTGNWTTGAGNVSGNEQSDGTSGNGSAANQVIRSAAEVLSATTAQTAAITGEDSSDWAAAVITFMEVSSDVTISCQSATLTLSGQSTTVVPGEVTVSANSQTLTLSGQAVTVTSEAASVTILCQYATLSLSGQQLAAIPGSVTVSCQSATLTLNGQQAAISVGAVVVSCQSVTLTLSGQQLTVATGASFVQCQSVTLAFAGQGVMIFPVILDFEEGDFSDFDVTYNEPDMAVNRTAAIVGDYGLEVTFDGDGTKTGGDKNINATDASLIRLRFYVDVSPLTIELDDGFTPITLRVGGTLLGTVFIRNISNNIYVAASIYDDEGTPRWTSNEIIDETELHWIEVRWVKESSDGADDGTLTLWVDDSLAVTNLTDVGNFTRWAGVDLVFFGNLGGNEFLTQGDAYLDDLIVIGTDTYIGPGAHYQNIACQPATLTLSGQSTTIQVGEAIVPCQAATLTLSGQSPTVLGAAVVSCQASTLTLSGQTANIGVGAITVPCQYVTITLSGQSLAVAVGAVTVSCQSVTLSLSGQIVTLVLGGVAVTCQSATLSLAGQSVTITVAAVVSCQFATLSLVEQSLTVVVGAITVPCQYVTLALSGQTLTVDVEGGPQSVSCQTATLSLSGQTLVIIAGEVSVSCQYAVLSLTGQTLNVISATIISCQSVTLTLNGQSLSVIPGTIAVAISSIVLSLSGQTLTVVAEGGPQAVSCQSVILNLSGQTLTTVAGAISVSCQYVVLALNGQTTTILAGATAISCQTGILTLSGQTLTTAVGGISVSCGATVLALNGQQLVVVSLAEGIIACQPAILALNGQTVALVLGAISISLQSITLSLSGQTVTITGQTSIAVGFVVLDLAGQSATIIIGAIAVSCQYAVLTLNGQSLTVVSGSIVVSLGYAILTLAGQQVTINTTIPSVIISASYSQLLLYGQTTAIIPGSISVSMDYASLVFTALAITIIKEILNPKADVVIDDSLAYEISINDSLG